MKILPIIANNQTRTCLKTNSIKQNKLNFTGQERDSFTKKDDIYIPKYSPSGEITEVKSKATLKNGTEVDFTIGSWVAQNILTNPDGTLNRELTKKFSEVFSKQFQECLEYEALQNRKNPYPIENIIEDAYLESIIYFELSATPKGWDLKNSIEKDEALISLLNVQMMYPYYENLPIDIILNSRDENGDLDYEILDCVCTSLMTSIPLDDPEIPYRCDIAKKFISISPEQKSEIAEGYWILSSICPPNEKTRHFETLFCNSFNQITKEYDPRKTDTTIGLITEFSKSFDETRLFDREYREDYLNWEQKLVSNFYEKYTDSETGELLEDIPTPYWFIHNEIGI